VESLWAQRMYAAELQAACLAGSSPNYAGWSTDLTIVQIVADGKAIHRSGNCI
jgi:hypothetical protein